eukprot:3461604-Prorocentrum_lima.AAC.1
MRGRQLEPRPANDPASGGENWLLGLSHIKWPLLLTNHMCIGPRDHTMPSTNQHVCPANP